MKTKVKRREFLEVAGGVGIGVGIGAWSTKARADAPVPFVDIAVNPVGPGAWALDSRGKVVSIGGAPVMGGPPEPEREVFVALGVTPDGKGLFALTQRGTLRTFGEAPSFDSRTAREHRAAFVDMAITPSGDGLWALDAKGKVFAFGAADTTLGLGTDALKQLHVALGSTPSGHGLYAITAKGTVRNSGDARAFRNDGAARNSRFVDMVVTAAGDGLWLLEEEGRIVSIGAAPVLGGPPEPERQAYVGLGVSPSDGSVLALTDTRSLRTFDIPALIDLAPKTLGKLPGLDAR